MAKAIIIKEVQEVHGEYEISGELLERATAAGLDENSDTEAWQEWLVENEIEPNWTEGENWTLTSIEAESEGDDA